MSPESIHVTERGYTSDSTVIAQPVFRKQDYWCFFLLTFLSFLAIGYLCFELSRFRDWQRHPILFIGMMLPFSVLLAVNQFRWFLLLLMRKPVAPQSHREWRVAVAVTFVPDSEPIELLEQTVQALVALDSPHDTWVLDEGNDLRVIQLCQKYGARHFSRSTDPKYQSDDGIYQSRTKYGNYNSWLNEHVFGKYDIVTTFDLDHVPAPEFLTRVLSYFEDPRVGYVQAAQAYRNQSHNWIARGAAEETYDYFSTIQMAAYGMGYPVIVGGHNSHRVEALHRIGGFAAHDADDILTTLHYRDAGWNGVYVPEILARGFTPVDLPGYLTQQRRWARSVLDIKLRTYRCLSSGTPKLARVMSLLHGFNYLLKSVLPVMALLVAGITCVVATDLKILSVAAIPPLLAVLTALGISEVYRQGFYLDPEQERGLHWRAMLLHWARWPQMLLALTDVLLNRRVAYTITAKMRTRHAGIRELWPHLLGSILLLGCWLVGTSNGHVTALQHLFVLIVVSATAFVTFAGSPHKGSISPDSQRGQLVGDPETA